MKACDAELCKAGNFVEKILNQGLYAPCIAHAGNIGGEEGCSFKKEQLVINSLITNMFIFVFNF